MCRFLPILSVSGVLSSWCFLRVFGIILRLVLGSGILVFSIALPFVSCGALLVVCFACLFVVWCVWLGCGCCCFVFYGTWLYDLLVS